MGEMGVVGIRLESARMREPSFLERRTGKLQVEDFKQDSRQGGQKNNWVAHASLPKWYGLPVRTLG